MSDQPTAATLDAEEPEASASYTGGLEGGAYEIIRSRLESHAKDLRGRLSKLNDERQNVFGAVDLSLIATERISTANNCEPRDMIAIGHNRFIFGYNVHVGLKSTTDLTDVFDIFEYHPDDHTLHQQPLDLLHQGSFAEDFAYLYKYYKLTRFVKFLVIGPHLYMAFRIGKAIDDIKVFKWLLNEGKLQYIGNRSDHEYLFPSQQEFEWTRAHRGMYREGMHPHVSIDDRLFVETVGGDLTIKIEDNTESGEGIYAEDVTNSDQTLDDAEIFYAIVGSLILLKILPYQEKDYRHLVYNEKTKTVRRIDSIAHSCVLLPDDHGIIFSDGYHLQTGDTKIFDSGGEFANMVFERRLPSPNGEDHLYIFYNRDAGKYVLMSYNIIDQKVETPIACHGYSVFPDGELIYFRADDRPQKHHTLQVWQTPFMEGEFRADQRTDSQLYKIGNADIVRAMAECHEVLKLLGKDDSYADLYIDLAKKAGDISDAYFWIGDQATYDLKSALLEIKGAADSAIAEFDKVVRLRSSTSDEMHRVSKSAKKLATKARNTRPDDIMGFVHSLAELRTVRGEIISLRDLRYVDLDAVQALENDVEDASAKVSEHCVNFLLQPDALDPYRAQVSDQQKLVPDLSKVTEANQVEEALNQSGAELEMLIDIVGNLKIEDSTQTTQIIDDISTIYSTLNQVRAALKNRRRDLARTEGVAQFGAQMKLLSQAVINYLDLCDSPDKCEEYLSKMMIQLEELEGRFADFDEYIEQLAEKRDEIYNAFEARKLSLVEARNRRTGALMKSAERILTSIRHRVDSLETINEINGYLAGDLMIEKVRDTITQLAELGDSVKADDLQTQLKGIREDAVRQLKDRTELFVDGKDIVRFGSHQFSVNTQDLELTVVPHEGHMCLHLAGTNFFEPITDPDFLNTESVWDQEVISENNQVYRAEFLAWKILHALVRCDDPQLETDLEAWQSEDFPAEEKLNAVQRFMAPRYAEGYTKGVHDQEALRILDPLAKMHNGIGLLRYAPDDRALALLFWEAWTDQETQTRLEVKLTAYGTMRGIFQTEGEQNDPQRASIGELRHHIEAFQQQWAIPCPRLAAADAAHAAEYLFEEIVDGPTFTVSPQAAELAKQFRHALTMRRKETDFEAALAELDHDPVAQFEITRDWLRGATLQTEDDSDQKSETSGRSGETGVPPVPVDEQSGTGFQPVAVNDHPHAESTTARYLSEAAVHLVKGPVQLTAINQIETTLPISGMTGIHPKIKQGVYLLDYLDVSQRLRTFLHHAVPNYQAYTKLKSHLVETTRTTMRLEEFKPKVMSAFVRNRLIDRVYLPLIGANLAKQMGTVGDDTRTDRMGMLLLISPPGYGKTTLMEYIANRLGITFMKINGPALGHDVKSLDPEEAPNASAREEIHKLNLSLEMGDNVMIYVDDIQHCHTEFLQKFISLCDAQRKIEGVYKGQPRTYDLRGKKVAVVMAGNPYTESGGKFQIPDMLANRADTYNLGDILGGHAEDFEASYIENSLTSNPVLAKLASRSQRDVYAVMEIATHPSGSLREGIDFEANYSTEEIDELVSVMQKLFRIRDTILRVNLGYIASAAMEDAYRTEPAFKLQGSYRNMNRIAEKVLPIMTDAEVEQLIVDHYENESQTLTTGAEANLLKFREMEGMHTETEATRWESIKKTFNKNLLMGGRGDDDPVNRVVGTLSTFTDGLDKIEQTLTRAIDHQTAPATLADVTIEKLEKIIGQLRAVPVDVEIKVVPVHEGEEAGAAKKKAASKKKSAAATTKKKAASKRKISGKEKGLPVDVEAKVEQGEATNDQPD